MKLDGIHHITCITGDAPRNVEFYTGTLGLRLVKKTVNQDDPTVYHLFYADENGTPGADLTFFEYPGATPGRVGAGMVHTIVWRVPSTTSRGRRRRRITRRGATAWRRPAAGRPRSSTGSGSGRSTSASRAACCTRSRPSARASRPTRTSTTWATR